MIIAIETASTDLSVALAAGDGGLIAQDAWSSPRRQEHAVLPRLLALIEQSGRSLADVSAVAVGIGPGSFTGLRVSMSLAKGIALALRLPVVGIPSLEAWLEAEPSAAAAVARAGAQDAYVLTRGTTEPRIVAAADLRAMVGGSLLAAPSELALAFELSGTLPPHGAAAAVARLAAERLAQDPAGDDLERLEPWYVQAPRGVAASEVVSRWP